jgi:mycothiol system anti-sigma-R factor
MNSTNTTNTQYGVHRADSPYTDAECEEIIAQLEALLDGEMDDRKQQEVQAMINNCNYCLEQYKIEKSLRDLVKEGFKKFSISNNLLNSIKNSIKNARSGV